MVTCLGFLRNHQTLFHRGCHSAFLSAMHECSSFCTFLTILPSVLFVCLPACLFCIIASLIAILSVKWHFNVVWFASQWLVNWASFHVLLASCLYSLEEHLFFKWVNCLFLLLLLLLLLRCRSSLYIMDINLLDIWFASIFLNLYDVFYILNSVLWLVHLSAKNFRV